MVGAGSGLRFQNITVQDEIEQEFLLNNQLQSQALASIINLVIL